MKNSFILYTENKEQVKLLSKDQRADLLMALFDYAESGETEELDPLTEMAFSIFKAKMDRDAEKWEETREKRAEAGRAGGLKSGGARSKTKQNEANEANASNAKQNEAKEANASSASKNEANEAVPVPVPVPVTLKSVSIIRPRGELGNVRLTDEEIRRMSEEYGVSATNDAIDFLDKYIADKGYKSRSKTHNLAMRRWVFDAVNEQNARRNKPKAPPGNKFGNFTQRENDYDELQRSLARAARGKNG